MIWIAKALSQAALSALPFGEQVNHRLQVMNGMKSAGYLRTRVEWGVTFWERIGDKVSARDKTVVEVGTGWDAIHAVFLAALGAERIWTYDHVAHLRLQLALNVVQELTQHVGRLAALSGQDAAVIGERLSAMARAATLPDLLATMRADYVAPGDASCTGLPNQSVDMVYSYAVMAHVPTAVLKDLVAETARILRPGGLSVHRIGLDDPFNAWKGGDEVDFLRLSDPVWRLLGENSVQSNNRLRAIEHIQLYEAQVGEVVWARKTLKPHHLERVKAMRVAKRFAHLPPEELAITDMDLIVRFGQPGTEP